MQISPHQGAFMAMLVSLMGAREAVEVGTFTGYSALAVARALPADGRLLCLDVSEEWTSIGRRYWDEAGVGDKIELRLGPGLDTLRTLPLEERFDVAFIDADKPAYLDYVAELVPRLRQGGLLMVDNTLWSGTVADPQVRRRHHGRHPRLQRRRRRRPAADVRGAADRRRPHPAPQALATATRTGDPPSPGRSRAGRRSPSPGTPAGASRGTTPPLRARRRSVPARRCRASRPGGPTWGGGAPSIRHSIWRDSAIDTGAVFSAISRARARAAGSRSSGAWTLRTSPPSKRLARREHPTGEHPLGRLLDADQPRQEPRRARLGHDAPASEHEADAGVLRRQADVHRQRHRDADADGRAVDGGDHGLEAVEDPQAHQAASVARHALRTGLVAPAAAGEGVTASRQVGSGAEAATPARDDHRPHVVVAVGPVEGVDQLVHHRAGEGVQLVGTVEGDRGDWSVELVGDLRVVHGAQPRPQGAPRPRPRAA